MFAFSFTDDFEASATGSKENVSVNCSGVDFLDCDWLECEDLRGGLLDCDWLKSDWLVCDWHTGDLLDCNRLKNDLLVCDWLCSELSACDWRVILGLFSRISGRPLCVPSGEVSLVSPPDLDLFGVL